MRVTQNGIETDIKVTSIILEADKENPDMMKRFMCLNCGEMVAQFRGGDIIFVVPGAIPVALPILIRCKPCKTKYLVNSIA